MQISDTVYPMYKAYIEPDLKTAHLRIYNTFNPFNGFMNATYILKSDKRVTPEAIKAVLKVRLATFDEVCEHEYIRRTDSWHGTVVRDGQ